MRRLGSARNSAANTAGIATYKFRPGIGSHSYQAVFVGTTSYAKSSSAAANLTVPGPYPTVTALSSSGTIGQYTLAATVTSNGTIKFAPAGNISFLDTTNGNASIGTAKLGTATAGSSFALGNSIDIAQEAIFTAAGDLNGDGISDVAVAICVMCQLGGGGGGRIGFVAILLGNGDGTFTSKSSLNVGVNPASIAVGDFNGDGALDLAITNSGDNTVSVLLGNRNRGERGYPGSADPVRCSLRPSTKSVEIPSGMTTRKLGFLFPGQGSQSVGMGRELFDNFHVARRTFEEADDALGFAISDLCFNGPEDRLKLTEFTQPAIFTVSTAAQRVLAEKGIAPSYVAGHSLGEYSANVAAGTISFADAVRTVRCRGQFMQDAIPAGEGAMAAVLGMSSEDAGQACADAAAETGGVVSPANFNSPEQTVISGSAAAVERAAALCKERGAKKTVMLSVSAPFHCALMQRAQDRLAPLLNLLEFSPAAMPVAVNVDAALFSDADRLRDALIRQVTGPVRWVESMRRLTEQQPTQFIEVGPGRVLSGLMRQIDRSQTCLNVGDQASLNKAMTSLETAAPDATD